jgi:peptidoglycan hydrolase CwlO-like protein
LPEYEVNTPPTKTKPSKQPHKYMDEDIKEMEIEKQADELLATLEQANQLGLSLAARAQELAADIDSLEKDIGATEAEIEHSGERMPAELLMATRELEEVVDATEEPA